jgi:hypothetical protein
VTSKYFELDADNNYEHNLFLHHNNSPRIINMNQEDAKNSVTRAWDYLKAKYIAVSQYVTPITAFIVILVIGYLWCNATSSSTTTSSRDSGTSLEVEALKVENASLKTDNEVIRKQLVTKHGMYLRAKKDLLSMTDYVNRFASYYQITNKNDALAAQRCTCSGVCARWKPRGKPSDCGNLTCPECSREDPPEATKTK